MKESKFLEFKGQVTNTFLKTVSAFSNYGEGRIVFGLADDGTPCPLQNPVKDCFFIENMINDSIRPQPDFMLEVNETRGQVILTVKEGIAKPYLYKSKAYKRNDTATIEVDALEFTRLTLAGRNLSYESLPSENQSLTFNFFEGQLKQVAGVEVLDRNVLKTLSLYHQKTGYNIAACLLADENVYPGIDIAIFGEDISVIKRRVCLEGISVLEAYEKAVLLYRDFYQYEQIDGSLRRTIQRIPEPAFREAVANALVHRTWDVNARIRVLMFDDKLQVVSPGGLPPGLTEEEYLAGRISVIRNPILANVFYRLNIVEIFGTGVLRIMDNYRKSLVKPQFNVTENSISVELPVISTELNLSPDEKLVYESLSRRMEKSISEIVANLPFGKSKTGEILASLADAGFVVISGRGRGTKYSLKR